MKLEHSRLLTLFYTLATTLPITVTVLLFYTELILPDPAIDWKEAAMVIPHILAYCGFLSVWEVFAMSWYGGRSSVWMIGSFVCLVTAMTKNGDAGVMWRVLTGVWAVVGVASLTKGWIWRLGRKRDQRRRLVMLNTTV